ncbi:MAG: hypothetical protein SPL30_04535 [Succinivibrio sp.]|nr:hypothetical protein [Succinivibrio sp.]
MRKKNISLPANVYLKSRLNEAGIRFDPNTVDTVCQKGLGTSFFLVGALLLLLWLLKLTGNTDLFPGYYFSVLAALCVIYELFYAARLWYYLRLRRLLRTAPYPVACEAYAIVIFDGGRCARPVSAMRSAIIYKETGSLKPRFFAGALKRGYRYEFRQDQLARVFMDRTNPKIYSVDDDSALSTVSRRHPILSRLLPQSFFEPGGASRSAGDESGR